MSHTPGPWILTSATSANILCTDGELHHPDLCGPNQWSAKTWKTRAGAARAAKKWHGHLVPVALSEAER